jgi:hypothetical protein
MGVCQTHKRLHYKLFYIVHVSKQKHLLIAVKLLLSGLNWTQEWLVGWLKMSDNKY